MDEFILLARTLIALGLTLLMAMLRLDAEKFGTAEYYEATRDGERPLVRRRLAWYGMGVAAAVALLYIHPSPKDDLHLGSGDRVSAVILGLLYGAELFSTVVTTNAGIISFWTKNNLAIVVECEDYDFCTGFNQHLSAKKIVLTGDDAIFYTEIQPLY